MAPDLWVLYGGVSQARGDLPTAKAAYDRALSMAPQLSIAHYGMGAVLMEEASFRQATEAFPPGFPERSAGSPGSFETGRMPV